MSLCLVRLIEPVFRSIEDHISGFLKTVLWLFQKHLFQKFFNFSSLSDLARQHYTFFVVFFLNFCKFFPLKTGKTILSLLLVLFSCFHAYFHAFKGHFWTSLFLGFFMIQGLFSEIDHWVLMGYWIRFGDFVQLCWN